jgi:hypothetical protein
MKLKKCIPLVLIVWMVILEDDERGSIGENELLIIID